MFVEMMTEGGLTIAHTTVLSEVEFISKIMGAMA
jgi:hypothetical protein